MVSYRSNISKITNSLEGFLTVIIIFYISLMFICLDTFWKNPQFSIDISEINSANETMPKTGPNTLVSLMQKPDKRNRRLTRNLHLGFCIFKASENCQTSLFTTIYPVSSFVLIALVFIFLSETTRGMFTVVGYIIKNESVGQISFFFIHWFALLSCRWKIL